MLRTAAAAAADQMDAGHETAGVDSEIASTTTSPTIITITSNTATSTTISRDQPPGVSSLAAVEAASEASLPPSPSTNLARDRKVVRIRVYLFIYIYNSLPSELLPLYISLYIYIYIHIYIYILPFYPFTPFHPHPILLLPSHVERV